MEVIDDARNPHELRRRAGMTGMTFDIRPGEVFGFVGGNGASGPVREFRPHRPALAELYRDAVGAPHGAPR